MSPLARIPVASRAKSSSMAPHLIYLNDFASLIGFEFKLLAYYYYVHDKLAKAKMSTDLATAFDNQSINDY